LTLSESLAKKLDELNLKISELEANCSEQSLKSHGLVESLTNEITDIKRMCRSRDEYIAGLEEELARNEEKYEQEVMFSSTKIDR